MESDRPVRVRSKAPAGISEVLITQRQVLDAIPVSDVTLWRWIKAGAFPRPVVIRRRNFWPCSQVNAWIAAEVKAAEHPPKGAAPDGE